MSWIDDINKKLEQRRQEIKEYREENPTWQAKAAAAEGAKSQLRSGKHNFQLMDKKTRSENSKKTTKFKDSKFQSEMAKRNKGKAKPSSAPLAKALNTDWVCEHCGKPGKGQGNLKRYGHDTGECLNNKDKVLFKKVTLDKFDKMMEILPDTFTKKEAVEICKQAGFGYGILVNMIENSGLIECIHEGTYKSPKDPAIYKKL